MNEIIDTEKVIKKVKRRDSVTEKILGVAERNNPERNYQFPSP